MPVKAGCICFPCMHAAHMQPAEFAFGAGNHECTLGLEFLDRMEKNIGRAGIDSEQEEHDLPEEMQKVEP